MSKTKQPVGRVLPPNFKHVIDISYYKKFTFWERCLIFFGCPVRATMLVYTESHTRKFHPELELKPVPREEEPQNEIRDRVD